MAFCNKCGAQIADGSKFCGVCGGPQGGGIFGGAGNKVQKNGVTVTTFDNGVVAYTNKSASAQTYPGGELEANGFKYVKGGTN